MEIQTMSFNKMIPVQQTIKNESSINVKDRAGLLFRILA